MRPDKQCLPRGAWYLGEPSGQFDKYVHAWSLSLVSLSLRSGYGPQHEHFGKAPQVVGFPDWNWMVAVSLFGLL